jgi:hypothetical protein
LQGSLNDRFVTGSKRLKQHATIGFDIGIDTPADKRYENAVAEVLVTVTSPPDSYDANFNPTGPKVLSCAESMLNREDKEKLACAGLETLRSAANTINSSKKASYCDAYEAQSDAAIPLLRAQQVVFIASCPDPPGVMALLPRDQTYNVANISGKSLSLAGAVTTQVLTGGVTWYRSTKNYYVLQAQDTVAVEDPPVLPDNEKKLQKVSTTFGWQFRPVLGQNRVRSGLRQLFAELSFPSLPPEMGGTSYGKVRVTTRWRKFDKKSGAVGGEITDPKDSGQSTNSMVPSGAVLLPEYDLTPRKPQVSWEDVGGGQVSVTAQGFYTLDTSVVIGSQVIGQGSPSYYYDPDKIRFVAPAAALLQANHVYLEEPGGEQTTILNISSPLDATSTNSPAFSVERATAMPFDSTTSRVEIKYVPTQRGPNLQLQPLVLVGGILYGLSDRPVVVVNWDKCRVDDKSPPCILTFYAPTDTLRAARKVRLGQLFFGKPDEHPLQILNDFSAAKLATVAKTDKCTLYAIQGSYLGNVKVKLGDHDVQDKTKPDPPCNFETMATSTVAKSPSKGAAAKQSAPKDPNEDVSEADKVGQSPPNHEDTCPIKKSYVDRSLGPTMLLVAVPSCNFQAIALFRGDPTDDNLRPFLLPVKQDEPTKPQIDPVTAKVDDKDFKLTGKNLGLIDLKGITYNGAVLPATIANDESYITVQLTPSFPKTAGFYAITVKLLDAKSPAIGAIVQLAPLAPPANQAQ